MLLTLVLTLIIRVPLFYVHMFAQWRHLLLPFFCAGYTMGDLKYFYLHYEVAGENIWSCCHWDKPYYV